MSAEVALQNEELRRLKEKEAIESKMLGLATLAAGAAHELATPLGTVSLIADHIKNSIKDSKLSDEFDALDNELNRCRLVLDKMRAQGSELQGELPETISMDEIFSEVSKSLGVIGNRVEFFSASKDIIIKSLKKSLIESLAALAKNGIQADANGIVEFKATEESDSVIFSIKDQGPGIGKELMSRIGEPFFTTKAPGSGMGLGLFLVNAFAKRVKGQFNITSIEGIGSTTILRIPRNIESFS